MLHLGSLPLSIKQFAILEPYILRKALGLKADGQPYIETINKLGYRFNAEVKRVSSEPEAVTIADISVPPADAAATNGHHSTKEISSELINFNDFANNQPLAASHAKQVLNEENIKPEFSRKWIISLLALLFIGSAFGFYFYNSSRSGTQPIASSDGNAKSIAVLPFRSIGEEGANEKLGLGMADAVITRLTNLKQIPVRSTLAVSSFTEKSDADLINAGHTLGVDTILEGTVQRDGERIRVSIQLIDVSSGQPLWAEKYDEKYTDIFNLQDSISVRIAQSLSNNPNLQQISKEAIAKGTTVNTEAYESYQLGVYFGNTRTKEGLLKAVSHFSRAVELDSGYAQAYALLADSYNMLGYYHFADSAEMRSKARTAAEKALSINDSVGEAYIALAQVQLSSGKDISEGRKLLERAIELAPYNSTARVRHGWSLLDSGKMEESANEMRLARQFDPLSPVSNGALCDLLTFKKNFSEAVTICERAVELAPAMDRNRLALANAYFFARRPDDAIKQAKFSSESGEEPGAALGALGYFYAKLNRREEAENIFNRLKGSAEKDPALFNDLTLIGYALGKKEESLLYFKKAYEKKVVSNLNFRFDPVWQEIRVDKNFTDLNRLPTSQ